jgi:hypothetical protein
MVRSEQVVVPAAVFPHLEMVLAWPGLIRVWMRRLAQAVLFREQASVGPLAVR